MDLITSLLNNMDLAKLVPELSSFLGDLRTIAVLAALIGPIVMLIAGMINLLNPPKEANHKLGFRTYFGMGSVEAWQFTQNLAGKLWSGLGGVMAVLTGIVCLIFAGKEAMQAVQAAAICLLVQAILAFLCWLGITVFVAMTFDKDGNRRN